MDTPKIIDNLQAIGLKVTLANLRINRWTDVKHLDGHTYGYFVNTTINICSWLRRGTDIKGSFKLDTTLKLNNYQIKKQVIQKEIEEKQAYFKKSLELATAYFAIEDTTKKCDYLERKKVNKLGCKIDSTGALVIPLRLILHGDNGVCKSYIRTIQTIENDGLKKFAFGGQKKGTMHLLNFPKKLLPSPENYENMQKYGGRILISEGYATAATMAMATGEYSIMAVDAGNLIEVVKSIFRSYPNAKIIICADNDLKLKETSKNSGKFIWSNTGVEAAIRCQDEYDVGIAIPDFSYLQNKVSADKLACLTDWNDLANAGGYSLVTSSFLKQVLKPIRLEV
jgi:putative DNA primase/helicase